MLRNAAGRSVGSAAILRTAIVVPVGAFQDIQYVGALQQEIDHKFPTTLFNQHARQCKVELIAAVVYYINIICPKQFHKKRLTAKSNELLSVLRNGYVSKPYNNTALF